MQSMRMTLERNSKNPKKRIRGLYLVTDRDLCLHYDLETVIRLAVCGGVQIVQLREKQLNSRDFLDLAFKIKKILSDTDVPLLINDRIDIALACDAEGVHLGQTDLPVKIAREILGPSAIIGLSIESMLDIKDEELSLVDYLGVSPIYNTLTKTDTKTPWGIEGLKKVRSSTDKPLVAIGGINESNALEMIKAGADSLAVVSYLCSAKDPELNAKNISCLF